VASARGSASQSVQPGFRKISSRRGAGGFHRRFRDGGAAIRRTAAEPWRRGGVIPNSHTEIDMARKYSRSAGKDVKREVRKYKKGKLKSGRSGKTVKSRKQAIAIGLSEARKKGKKVPKKKTGKKKSRK
jgi:hypothetical protein